MDTVERLCLIDLADLPASPRDWNISVYHSQYYLCALSVVSWWHFDFDKNVFPASAYLCTLSFKTDLVYIDKAV